jgi:hypothetical protein
MTVGTCSSSLALDEGRARAVVTRRAETGDGVRGAKRVLHDRSRPRDHTNAIRAGAFDHINVDADHGPVPPLEMYGSKVSETNTATKNMHDARRA